MKHWWEPTNMFSFCSNSGGNNTNNIDSHADNHTMSTIPVSSSSSKLLSNANKPDPSDLSPQTYYLCCDMTGAVTSSWVRGLRHGYYVCYGPCDESMLTLGDSTDIHIQSGGDGITSPHLSPSSSDTHQKSAICHNNHRNVLISNLLSSPCLFPQSDSFGRGFYSFSQGVH